MIWRSCSTSVIGSRSCTSAASSSLPSTRDLFASPQHPYTEALLDAVPVPDPDRVRPAEVLAGEVPSPMRPPARLPFSYALPLCGGALPRRGAAHARGETGALRGLSPAPAACRRRAPPNPAVPEEFAHGHHRDQERRLGDRLAGAARPPRLHARRRCRLRRQHHHPRRQGLRRRRRHRGRRRASAW